MSTPTKPSECDLSTAVIAVHGVADQRRGDTAEAVAALLASHVDGAVQRQDWLLSVEPARPCLPHEPSARGWKARAITSLRQSWRSDFITELGTPKPDQGVAPHAGFDLGGRFTDYLLFKRTRASASREIAEVAMVQVRGPGLSADVFELYWADLSRVQSGVLRLFSELATLLFRFGRLGTEAQSLAAAHSESRALRALSVLQQSAEWLFSRLIGPAALQLVIGLLVLGAALWTAAHLSTSLLALSAVLGGSAAVWLVYFVRRRWIYGLFLGGCTSVLSVLFLLGPTEPRWFALWSPSASQQRAWAMAGFGALLLVLYNLLTEFWQQRFPATRVTSWLLFVATIAALWWSTLTRQGPAEEQWVRGAVGACELVLVMNLGLWSLESVLLVATVVLYECVMHGKAGKDNAVRRVLVTARLALFTSVGAFLVSLMVFLAVANDAVSDSLANVHYTSIYFELPEALRPELLYFNTVEPPTAGQFLAARVKSSGASLAPVALLLLGLVGFVVIVFAPSVLREVRIVRSNDSLRLGDWLTSGYRAIERLVRWWGLFAAPVVLLIVFLLGLRQWQRVHPGALLHGWAWESVLSLQELALALSSEWLSSIVKGVAGGAVGLFAIGKVAIRQIKALRAPLDAALDVDNHFREFPRHAISRVQIVERYLALLEHLQARGYSRLIIVAHSQGTVITADLLRYLRQRHLMQAKDREGAVAKWLAESKVSMLTVGSPLRQLYALRFRRTYAWVTEPLDPGNTSSHSGPAPSALGLRRWHNLWASGDYVGRWLWTSSSEHGAFSVEEGRYESIPRAGSDAMSARWLDVCIGDDAHTHYFDHDKCMVAAHLHELVTQD